MTMNRIRQGRRMNYQTKGNPYRKKPRVNMAATEWTRAAPRDILAPAKAALGGVGCSVTKVGPIVGSVGMVGVVVGSALVGASLGVIVGEAVATTGAAVGDAVGKRVGVAVSLHFLPL